VGHSAPPTHCFDKQKELTGSAAAVDKLAANPLKWNGVLDLIIRIGLDRLKTCAGVALGEMKPVLSQLKKALWIAG
jgi:hypothetical protein